MDNLDHLRPGRVIIGSLMGYLGTIYALSLFFQRYICFSLGSFVNVNYFFEDSVEKCKTSRAHTPLVGAALVGQGLLIRVAWSHLGGF